MPVLDITGDGHVSAFGDGLILMRYMLGYRGDDLTSGTIGIDDTRDTGPKVEAYIRQIWPRLDADGNGEVTFSDVLMIFLYLIGFRDTNLIGFGGNNTYLIEPGASRYTADMIEAYIATLDDP